MVIEKPITDQPSAANGEAAAPAEPSKDVQMTGALAVDGEETAVPSTHADADADAAKPGDKNGQAETQPSESGDGKRKADALEESPDGDDASARKKRKAGRPSKANGATNGGDKEKEKESVGHKVAKKVQKVLPPVGKTERKTRSQGPV